MDLEEIVEEKQMQEKSLQTSRNNIFYSSTHSIIIQAFGLTATVSLTFIFGCFMDFFSTCLFLGACVLRFDLLS